MKRYGWFGLLFAWVPHAHAADFPELMKYLDRAQSSLREPIEPLPPPSPRRADEAARRQIAAGPMPPPSDRVAVPAVYHGPPPAKIAAALADDSFVGKKIAATSADNPFAGKKVAATSADNPFAGKKAPPTSADNPFAGKNTATSRPATQPIEVPNWPEPPAPMGAPAVSPARRQAAPAAPVAPSPAQPAGPTVMPRTAEAPGDTDSLADLELVRPPIPWRPGDRPSMGSLRSADVARDSAARGGEPPPVAATRPQDTLPPLPSAIVPPAPAYVPPRFPPLPPPVAQAAPPPARATPPVAPALPAFPPPVPPAPSVPAPAAPVAAAPVARTPVAPAPVAQTSVPPSPAPVAPSPVPGVPPVRPEPESTASAASRQETRVKVNLMSPPVQKNLAATDPLAGVRVTESPPFVPDPQPMAADRPPVPPAAAMAAGDGAAWRNADKLSSRPGFIEYVIRAQSLLQRQTNPYRVSDDQRAALPADTVFLNEVSGAAIVPLLSDRTRLIAAGSFGDARYENNRQLSHQPKRLDVALQWQAGRLWQGAFGISDEDRLNRFLSLSAPDRDMIKSRSIYTDLGLRVTESLTLPQVSFQHNTLRYEFPLNATTYNRDENRVQAAVRYSGYAASYLQAGVMQSTIDFIDRTPGLISTIDNHYVDREAFIDGQWEYSPKTLMQARVGYRQRTYANLSERDVSLITAEAKAAWQYSPKTRFDLAVWHRPYGNEEDPGILYSTLTGIRASIRWAYSDKLWASFNVVRENQKNTRLTAANAGSSENLRFGPRIEWAVNQNVTLVLDGWRDNVQGNNYPSSNSTVVRLGVVLSRDNRGLHAPEKLLRNADCASPRYVETTTCYD